MTLRTEDTAYGADYWNSFDGGLGYADSVMWEDLAFTVKETYGIQHYVEDDVDLYRDVAGDVHHLDVGCAYGYLVRHLRRRGFDSHGLDVSAHAIGNAPEDTRPYVKLRDVTDKAIPNYSSIGFNLVTCFETMEHIVEDQVDRALGIIFDRLDPGGKALFTICLDDRDGWDSDPTHVTIKSREWWEDKLDTFEQSHGMSFDAVSYMKVREFYLYKGHNGIFTLQKEKA